ncbi:MAG: enoyl-CoA hydratase/isomerase family protein [Gammaproteobacteria bacterium]|nr:enoyl-CoA hydratase/isomerase family protein [Gammaproteobacteria bacterium]
MSIDLTTIRYEKHGGRATIVLNRPQVLNAINARVLDELEWALRDCAADGQVRVVLLRAAGHKAFSSGIDVDFVRDKSPFEVRHVGRRLHDVFSLCRTLPKVILVAVDGLCLGAGLELAVSCDLIVATARSQFGLPNINVGIPAIVEAAVLPQAIGIMHARELCFTGLNWGADKALARGLINEVCAQEDLDSVVSRWLQRLETRSPMALMTQKEIIHAWMTTDIEAAIEFSINTVGLNWTTRDQKEGMGAFVEKRPADFT